MELDQPTQCPVCTLFLHSGMSLESHLDTHPKDQVIRALCKISSSRSSYGSRCTTPMQSERSYRSRSRTPALDGRATPKRGPSNYEQDKDRSWRRPPRTPARCETPADSFQTDIQVFGSHMEGSPVTENDKTNSSPQFMRPGPMSDIGGHFIYVPDQSQEEVEQKYSRSAEYGMQNQCKTENVFTYNMQGATKTYKSPKQRNEINILPRTNTNIDLIKSNVAPVQYLNPGVKPLQFMVPANQSFVQSQHNATNNMIISGSMNNMLQPVVSKNVNQMFPNQINHMSTSGFTPGTTVVTQNSQIIYREMVHNIDGKPYIQTLPAVMNVRDDMAGTSQSNPVYHNVMVVNPYPNGSCMYPQQQIVATTSSITNYEEAINYNNADKRNCNKTVARNVSDINQTLVIEVGPIGCNMDTAVTVEDESVTSPSVKAAHVQPQIDECQNDRVEASEMSRTKKGLKILSNIKVEVPIQHHKSMLNEVVDLTGAAEETDLKIAEPYLSAKEAILPDMEENKSQNDSDIQMCEGESSSIINTFSVIKNIGNPSMCREGTSKSSYSDSKDTDQNDSCSIPDLTCKEKASISPCSELSGEYVDNSNDRSCSPVKEPKEECNMVESVTQRTPRQNPLKLNNLYVKKNKKVLQIKNSRFSTLNDQSSSSKSEESTSARSDCAYSLPLNLVETFKQNNVHCTPTKNELSGQTEHIESSQNQDSFDADTEEQSMDIEPIAHSTMAYSKNTFDSGDLAKEETMTQSGRDAFGETEKKEFAQLETMRPVNVIAYGSMANNGPFHCESNQREDNDGISKERQAFVNMMSENYFGDNIYADYFTPDRAESFTNGREDVRQPPIYCSDVQKTELATIEDEPPCGGGYNMWGEASHMLPNFIHESYKVPDYDGVNASEHNPNFVLNSERELESGNYHELTCRNESFDRENTKLEILSEDRSNEENDVVNICADERMPPRGELSGQESNGDMDTPWTGMYQDLNSSTSYDLMARETWVSDGSDVETAEKNENLEQELEQKMNIEIPKRNYKCASCALSFDCPKERRVHRAKEHPAPSTATSGKSKPLTIRRLATIKKEEKVELNAGEIPPVPILEDLSALESKPILADSKPKLEGIVIKEEPRRRRRDYVCPVCKQDFLTDLAFHAHLKVHPLECLTCGKYFFKRANLQLHIRTHLGIKKYKCEVCEKRFTTKQKLMEHHNVHTGAAPVKCTHCTSTFRRHSNMIQHRNRHHFHLKKKVRDFVCHCGEVFHSRRKLLWHKETHDDRPKACPYCSDKFVHAASLTRHIRRAHNEYYLPDERRKKENVECPICMEVYLKNNLETHIQTHRGEKPYNCVICNKSFTTKWNLKLHRWTHANRSAKPFKCALCKGAFIRQADYISHMNAHKSVRPYTCNYCGCQFIRKYNCQRHVKEHESVKKYTCTVAECGKMFHRSYYLTEHMRVHTGARPFSCNICGKTSSNKSNHNKHIKIHHAREPVATEG